MDSYLVEKIVMTLLVKFLYRYQTYVDFMYFCDIMKFYNFCLFNLHSIFLFLIFLSFSDLFFK